MQTWIALPRRRDVMYINLDNISQIYHNTSVKQYTFSISADTYHIKESEEPKTYKEITEYLTRNISQSVFRYDDK